MRLDSLTCIRQMSAIIREHQAKLAKDKEVEVLHGVKFSQPLRPRLAAPVTSSRSASEKLKGKVRHKQTLTSLVGNSCARGTCERYNLESRESGFNAPFTKISRRVIESITEFDQHVKRHQKAKRIFAPCIVD